MGERGGHWQSVPGQQGGGAGEGRQIPGRAVQPERRGKTALPDGPAIKGRNTPARLPPRFPAPGKCTSHLGFGLARRACRDPGIHGPPSQRQTKTDPQRAAHEVKQSRTRSRPELRDSRTGHGSSGRPPRVTESSNQPHERPTANLGPCPAKGTVEQPGKNVKRKSGLNRSILAQGWY